MALSLNINRQRRSDPSWLEPCIELPPCRLAPAVSVCLPGSREDTSSCPTEPPSQQTAPEMPGWPSPELPACPEGTYHRYRELKNISLTAMTEHYTSEAS